MCPGRFGPELPKRAVRVVCERQAREGGACGVQTRARGVQTRARGRRNRGEVVLDLIPGGRLRPRRHAFFCPGCCGTTVPASAFSLGRASGPTEAWATRAPRGRRPPRAESSSETRGRRVDPRRLRARRSACRSPDRDRTSGASSRPSSNGPSRSPRSIL